MRPGWGKNRVFPFAIPAPLFYISDTPSYLRPPKFSAMFTLATISLPPITFNIQMASIRIDFSNIEIQSITLGESIAETLSAIRGEMDRRGLSGRDLHRACVQRYSDGHTENCPSYQTVAKFLSGNGEMTTYETVTAIIGALGYEVTGSAVFVEGGAIKVIKEARAQGLVLPRGVPSKKKKK